MREARFLSNREEGRGKNLGLDRDSKKWFLVLGSWFLVLGSWFLVLGSWFGKAVLG